LLRVHPPRGAISEKRYESEGGLSVNERGAFTIGAAVSCEDGECGELRRVVIESDNDAVTHLVVGTTQRKDRGKLVPIGLVEAAGGNDVRLRCTMAQFGALEDAETTEVRTESAVDFESQAASARGLGPRFAPRPGGRVLDPDGLGGAGVDGTATGMRTVRRDVSEDAIPDGEGEVWGGQHVHASDGPIGHVRGLVADPSNHELTYILLDEGHLWGEKEVAIPVSAVRFVVDDGVYLNLTKREVGDLPPVEASHPE
jgi:hypothetical protein